MPPAVCTIEQQLERTYENFQAKTTNLEKFIYLTSLQDRNETLFYRLVLEHIDEMMPIVYTPVVGEACQKYSHIYRRGRGLYIAYEQRDRIEKILRNAGIAHPSVIVVTDGERILGLGDQGAGGMGIPIGKLCLYTLCAGISALQHAADHARRRHRQRGAAERPALPRPAAQAGARRGVPGVHRRLRGRRQEGLPATSCCSGRTSSRGTRSTSWSASATELCTFNDDIQGTAGVVVAGIYGALRITGAAMRDQRMVFAGAGASAQGISDLLVAALVEDGLTREEARRAHLDGRQQRAGHQDRARPRGLQGHLRPRPSDEVAGYACKDRARSRWPRRSRTPSRRF